MTANVTDFHCFWIHKSIVSDKHVTGCSAWTRSPTRTSVKDSASKGKSPVANQQVHYIPVNPQPSWSRQSHDKHTVFLFRIVVLSLSFSWSTFFIIIINYLFIEDTLAASVAFFFWGRIHQVQAHVTVEAALLSSTGMYALKVLKWYFYSW